jgi:DNA-binding IclR family transcriptional regulator
MLNDERTGGRPYQEQVPAVVRAVRVLERLAAAGGSCALADLARELEVGPSSLLAILTTLRRADLVTRTASGRYEIGPGLAALGNAAACRIRACERFATVAEELVTAFGETVVLWIRHEETFVLAAAREGTQPLRYVPTPGMRLRATQTRLAELGVAQPVVEEELLPGIAMVGVALPGGPGECAAVALAGPTTRIATPTIRTALLAACPASGAPAMRALTHDSPRPLSTGGETSGPIDGTELDEFLRQSLVATLSYLSEDGFPATVPLWYSWDGASFWLASRPGSEWVEHVRLDPRVSLAVSESSPPLRRVLARGRLIEVDDPGGARRAEIEAQLAARYAGFDAAREPAAAGRGRLLELKPERLIAWRGLLRHPKLPPEPESPGTNVWRHLG